MAHAYPMTPGLYSKPCITNAAHTSLWKHGWDSLKTSLREDKAFPQGDETIEPMRANVCVCVCVTGRTVSERICVCVAGHAVAEMVCACGEHGEQASRIIGGDIHI